ncbi:MAG TPA: dihydrolipoyl dehydrogenase [Gammaproteobacteria bacterium]|nr:dihydrolipoyl dehydrogenase [Gammaproteobacteria bacterium]
MSNKPIEIKVPDLDDASDVEIIEVLVSAGDTIEAEDGLITLETDKAAMDVPSPQAGTIKEMKVKTGDKVSQGDVIALLEAAQASEEDAKNKPKDEAETEPEPEKAEKQTTEKKAAPKDTEKNQPKSKTDKQPVARDTYDGKVDVETETLVLGAGPGGYTAAFRAADLGQKVTLVERWDALGGVCLNVGCIPSKALLHSANVIEEAAFMADHGITFGKPKIDNAKLRDWKDKVIGKLTGGLVQLAKQRKVNVVHGNAEFLSANHVKVSGKKDQVIAFKHCIIAAGSEAVKLPGIPDDSRIMDSTGALELEDIPKRLLVIGGGIIGLEMACVYDALGSKVSVVELTDELIPGADRDIVKPLEKRIGKRYEAIMTGVKVAKVEAQKQGIKVTFEGKKAPEPQVYDRVLVAVGRKPNGKTIAAEMAGVSVDERGFIPVDNQQRTNQPHIFAIGDIAGQPMLAHKATHEGKLAAEVAGGSKHAFDARVIPSVAYTDPEIAWVGLTETQAKADKIEFEKGAFPWAASGRALSLGREEGLTKLLFDKKTNRVIGGAAVGPNAGELIAEIALAIEMGADAEDIGLTIHAHPTLSETVAFAAEAQAGVLTDLYIPKKK